MRKVQLLERSLVFHGEPRMLQNLFQSWPVVGYCVQQCGNEILHLCVKEKNRNEIINITESERK